MVQQPVDRDRFLTVAVPPDDRSRRHRDRQEAAESVNLTPGPMNHPEMKPEDVGPLVAAFPLPDYYVSEEEVRDSLRRRYPFNVLQPSAGAKIDLVPLPQDAFSQEVFQRRCRLEYDEAGHTASFITATDIILAKLLAFRNTGSDKHLRDVRGVLVTQWEQLDLDEIRGSAGAAGLLEELDGLLEIARRAVTGEG